MSAADVTQLLVKVQQGDHAARNQLWEEVYEELQRIAHRQLGRRRSGQTLATTALVHEAYLKLVDGSRAEWQDRLHFFAVSAKAMRYILIDYARAKKTQKRGGGLDRVTLDEGLIPADDCAEVFIALDGALKELSQLNSRLADVVEMRFFGGMTEQEIADLLDVHVRTVRRDWRKAKAWLTHALSEDAPTDKDSTEPLAGTA